MGTCLTCEFTRRRDAGGTPPWDSIHRATYWDVVHSYNSALPGWLVIIARRHIAAIDEMTEDESVELGRLLRRVSIALREFTGCARTYVAQFAESPDHPHVHFHVVPRMANQPADRRGPDVFKYLGVPPDQRVGEAEMDRIALAVRRILETP
jgi:diadenosine tetraphosphate (Ap4A) HIT family hydrolase